VEKKKRWARRKGREGKESEGGIFVSPRAAHQSSAGRGEKKEESPGEAGEKKKQGRSTLLSHQTLGRLRLQRKKKKRAKKRECTKKKRKKNGGGRRGEGLFVTAVLSLALGG